MRQFLALSRLLNRPGRLADKDFEPSPDLLGLLAESARVLVVGAGGLGCELLKNLALLGFGRLDVIDMDTIDLSNLNRQFLFAQGDIGRSKATVAAEVIEKRVPHCRVTAHHCRIQDRDAEFYRQFHVVVCGLDSVVARRWINGMLLSLLHYEDDGTLDMTSLIPMVDGGTEGFKGNARVILPGVSACVECTLGLYPPQVNFPLCTIAHTPRLPEHCIEYVRVLLWPKENPWGPTTAIDSDDPAHLNWILKQAEIRAAEFNISGVDYRLTQGVVKRIIPAVASTNAVIAATCATEVFKLATRAAPPLDNYLVFNDSDGIYSYVYQQERSPDCIACSRRPVPLMFADTDQLSVLINHLTSADHQFQMRSPGVTTVDLHGKNRTLYMTTIPSLEEHTKPNLKKTFAELGLVNGQQLMVADVTTPATCIFTLKLQS